jgi:hypothetical protein
VEIRPARTADAAAIANVHVHTWQAAYSHVFREAFLVSLSAERRDAGCRKAGGWHADGRRTDTIGGTDVAEVRYRIDLSHPHHGPFC